MATCKDCLHFGACRGCRTNLAGDTEVCEDFTNKSEWVHLPCKVGDFAWFFRGLIDDIKISKEPIAYILVDRDNQIKIQDVYGWYNKIGETVFLTKEEAEKALAERNEK